MMYCARLAPIPLDRSERRSDERTLVNYLRARLRMERLAPQQNNIRQVAASGQCQLALHSWRGSLRNVTARAQPCAYAIH